MNITFPLNSSDPPFGMVMPGRNWAAATASGYGFGFNGQEIDTEIHSGSQTAIYWQYDNRLGKRWNVDPVFRAFISQYACFSNNPITRVDPKGDDDYFDIKGNYIGTDRNGSHFIKVVTEVDVQKQLYLDYETKTVDPSAVLDYCSLTDYSYNFRRFESWTRLNRILNHYTGEDIYPEEYSNNESPASTKGKVIRIHIFKGELLKGMNNYHILKSTINDHEKLHKTDNEKGIQGSYERHTEIYLHQISCESFKLCNDIDFQQGIVASGVKYAVNSFFQENTKSREQWQKEFNDALQNNNINLQISISGGNSFKSASFTITNTETGAQSIYMVKKKSDPH